MKVRPSQSKFCSKLLHGLVDHAIWNRDYFSDRQRYMLSPQNFFKDFATLQLKMNRRSGHSSFAAELNDLWKPSIILAPYKFQTRLPVFQGCNVNTIDRFLDPFSSIGQGVFLNDGLIIVDCASHIPKEKIDRLYDKIACSGQNPRLFILLG